MKAMVLKAPRELRLETVKAPRPTENEVLVRLFASGVCGTDQKIFSWWNPGPLSPDHGP